MEATERCAGAPLSRRLLCRLVCQWSYSHRCVLFWLVRLLASAASARGLMRAGAGDNAVRIFCEDAASSQDSSQPPSWSLAAEQRQAHPLDVNCVRWHPVKTGLLASASDDAVVKLWMFTPDPAAEGMRTNGPT